MCVTDDGRIFDFDATFAMRVLSLASVLADRGKLGCRAFGESARAPDGDNVAYILYTSGSTGNPKGVVLPLRAVHALADDLNAHVGATSDDVMLAFTTLCFDALLRLFGCEEWHGRRRNLNAKGLRPLRMGVRPFAGSNAHCARVFVRASVRIRQMS